MLILYICIACENVRKKYIGVILCIHLGGCTSLFLLFISGADPESFVRGSQNIRYLGLSHHILQRKEGIRTNIF